MYQLSPLLTTNHSAALLERRSLAPVASAAVARAFGAHETKRPRSQARSREDDGAAASARKAQTRHETSALVGAAMASYAAGDDSAFDALYALLAPRLYRTCIFLIGRGEAEDLLQEVFLKIHRARGCFVPGGNVIAWSLAIARTTCVDRLRRRYRSELATDTSKLDLGMASDESSPESCSNGRALEAQIAAALLALSESLRSAYVLVRIEGLTCAQAAQALGTSTNAIKQRVHRAQEAVKISLSAHGYAEVLLE